MAAMFIIPSAKKRHPEWGLRPFQASRPGLSRATRGVTPRTSAGLTYKGLRFRNILAATMPQEQADVNFSLKNRKFTRSGSLAVHLTLSEHDFYGIVFFGGLGGFLVASPSAYWEGS